jgi:aspartyl-tRNA(Asn)/glutamyl-tRNA(Gln) amidotransferase subunit B
MVEGIRARMPELPANRLQRLVSSFGLAPAEAALITDEATTADYYERAVEAAGGHYREVANWLVGDLFALARGKGGFERVALPPEQLAELVTLVRSGEINAQAGKEVLAIADETGQTPSAIVAERGLRQETDESKMRGMVRDVLDGNPAAVADYRGGKQAALGFLIGQTMKAMRGTGNPAIVRQVMIEELQGYDA